MTTRYLICGGRDFDDKVMFDRALRMLILHPEDAVVIHGGATGADSLADAWARERGVPVEVYRAEWGRYKRAAGPIRNQRMLDEGKPDVVLAFPGGQGTWDMVIKAREARLVTIQIVA